MANPDGTVPPARTGSAWWRWPVRDRLEVTQLHPCPAAQNYVGEPASAAEGYYTGRGEAPEGMTQSVFGVVEVKCRAQRRGRCVQGEAGEV